MDKVYPKTVGLPLNEPRLRFSLPQSFCFLFPQRLTIPVFVYYLIYLFISVINYKPLDRLGCKSGFRVLLKRGSQVISVRMKVIRE